MSNEQPCKACEDFASFGLGKCVIHCGDPVPPFDITEGMAKNDKYGEAILLSDRADKDVEQEIARQHIINLTDKGLSSYTDSNGYTVLNYPEAKRPEPNYPKA